MPRRVLAGDSEHAGDVGEGPIDKTRGAVHSHSEASSSESAPLGGQFRLELPGTIPAARRQGEEKPEGEWRAFHPSLAGVAAAPREVNELVEGEQDEDRDQDDSVDDDEIMLI